MKHAFVCCLFIGIIGWLPACKSGKKTPDVSHISVNIATIRFENELFKIDTTHTDAALQQLHNQIPEFTQDFLFNILGIRPNENAVADVNRFVTTYRGIYDTVKKIIPNWQPIEAEIKEGLQRVKYYFPNYKAPEKIITFIGPLNSYGNIITRDALAVGLQLYLGKDCGIYTSDQGLQMYPRFISRRFEPSYIATNCMKNIIEDMFAANKLQRPLVEQMIEAGKKMYVLDALLPNTADSIKTGYTQQQLDECQQNEKNIWAFFVQNELLYSNDLSLVSPYITDGPKTETLGDRSPGNIGLFVGWQIVKKWMHQNDKRTLLQLMQKNAKELFLESKYKP